MEPGETAFIGGKKITYCEFRIIQLAVQGYLRKEIAKALGKSDDTIDTQMRYLYLKLGIEKINDLITWALDKGFDRQGNYKPKALIIPPVIPPAPKPKKKKKKK